MSGHTELVGKVHGHINGLSIEMALINDIVAPVNNSLPIAGCNIWHVVDASLVCFGGVEIIMTGICGAAFLLHGIIRGNCAALPIYLTPESSRASNVTNSYIELMARPDAFS